MLQYVVDSVSLRNRNIRSGEVTQAISLLIAKYAAIGFVLIPLIVIQNANRPCCACHLAWILNHYTRPYALIRLKLIKKIQKKEKKIRNNWMRSNVNNEKTAKNRNMNKFSVIVREEKTVSNLRSFVLVSYRILLEEQVTFLLSA